MELVGMSPAVQEAIASKKPVVALESAFLSHGLPWPINLQTALAMQEIIESEGTVPAMVGMISGKAKVGLSREETEALAQGKGIHKVSTRDLAIATAQGWTGGTTVSASVYIAYKAGLAILATGGIGGIHLDKTDISPDLPQLAQTPILVICSGAKSILDLPATREWLETHSIPVIGYKIQEFPGFYSRQTGLKVDVEIGSPREAAEILLHHRRLGLTSAVLVAVPVPEKEEVRGEIVQAALKEAMAIVEKQGISGPALTPILLTRLGELTGGATTRANVALLKENARVAAQIARAWMEKQDVGD